jgi:hypothetical protein
VLHEPFDKRWRTRPVRGKSFHGIAESAVIPHPVELLDPEKHTSYRTLHFLTELKQQQAYHRGRLLQGGAVTVPSHARYPVLIVSPREELKSGLVDGLIRHEVLPQEFEAGRTAAEALVDALSKFIAGNDDALNEFLLDFQTLPDLSLYQVPRPGLWALWTNPRWLA